MFVCGLALDFCVLDTAVNAVAAGRWHCRLLLLAYSMRVLTDAAVAVAGWGGWVDGWG